MKYDTCPKKRWNWRRISSLFAPVTRKEQKRGGGERQMRISTIETLAPAASTTKGN
jgi:hypothetical protein